MSKKIQQNKFNVVKTTLEVIYGLTWAIAIVSAVIVLLIDSYSGEEKILISAGIIGGTIMCTTMILLTVCAIESRNFLAELYVNSQKDRNLDRNEIKNNLNSVDIRDAA